MPKYAPQEWKARDRDGTILDAAFFDNGVDDGLALSVQGPGENFPTTVLLNPDGAEKFGRWLLNCAEEWRRAQEDKAR